MEAYSTAGDSAQLMPRGEPQIRCGERDGQQKRTCTVCVHRKVRNRKAVSGVRNPDSGSPGQGLMPGRAHKRVVMFYFSTWKLVAWQPSFWTNSSDRYSAVGSLGRFSLAKKKGF